MPFVVSAASSSRGDDEGTLKVYVEVEDHYNYERLDPRDFDVFVDARSPSKNHFAGSDTGTSVYFEGSYRVYVYGHTGYKAEYTSGCSGRLDGDETRTCRVTMQSSRYSNYPEQPCCSQQPYYQPQQPCCAQAQPCCGQVQPYYPVQQPCCAQPVTYVQSYVPRFPNTGFPPISAAAVAFAAVLLIGAGAYFLPHVRKTITTVLG